jgi:hypothetical protein
MMKNSKIILSCLISIMLATAASAAWTPVTGKVLLTSLPGGTLIVGDKEFSGFNLDVITVAGGVTLPDPNLMTVQGVQDIGTGDYGLRFNGFSWSVVSDQVIAVDLSFKVSVLPGYDKYIKDVWIYLTGAGATGTGLVSAGENVWDDFPGGSAIASLTCSKQAGDGGAHLSDYAEFTPVKEIYIQTKYISVTGGADGSASFSEFFQFYSQIPEPATLVLLGLGTLSLLRRKRKA